MVDRLIQQALHQVLQPLFEPTFSDGKLRLSARVAGHIRRFAKHTGTSVRESAGWWISIWRSSSIGSTMTC